LYPFERDATEQMSWIHQQGTNIMDKSIGKFRCHSCANCQLD